MKKLLIIIALLLVGLTAGNAQNMTTDETGTVYIEPLFTYPEAPDFLGDLGNRADWLMDNFWNDMNFKQKSVHQAALQHAFEVYSAPMRFATKGKVISSVERLMKSLEKNPVLMAQFMKAAEETFHSPRSEVFIDEVYEMFLQSYVNHKKIKKERKVKYAAQLEALRATVPGSVAPSLPLTDAEGNSVDMPRGSKYTLIIFGNPANTDLRQWLLRLNSLVQLEQMAQAGSAAVVFVSYNDTPAAFASLKEGMPEYVQAFRAVKPQEKYDIRVAPCTYLLDGEGKILLRNATLQQSLAAIQPD